MFAKIINTLEHLMAFGALILFLTLIGTNDAQAQNAWDQCRDGRAISKCQTYDCPNGDTNNDGSCSLEDDNARLTDVRNDSFCANPISGCGEVRYYGAGDSNSCSVRVEENDNNCELYSVAQPTFTPRATQTPIATSTPAPSNDYAVCSGLVVRPNTGESPLEVDIEVKPTGNLDSLDEYEFIFTRPDGTSNGTVVQSSPDLTQTLTQIGTHELNVNLVHEDGVKRTSSACRIDIDVTGDGIGGGGDVNGTTTKGGEELPETGSPFLVGGIFLILGIGGVYMYDKYRYI